MKRLGALCVFLASWLALQHRALNDIAGGHSFSTALFGYAPQKTTQFLFWDASDHLTILVLFQAVLFALLAFIAARIVRLGKEWFFFTMLFMAMGMNLWERIVFGGVIDYFKFGTISFNLADGVIIGSSMMWLLRAYFNDKMEG